MSATGLDVFDKTLHTTHIWLDELMEEIGPDRRVAWHVLGAVLRAIRDRVPLELAVHLGRPAPDPGSRNLLRPMVFAGSDREVANAGGVLGSDRTTIRKHASSERPRCDCCRVPDSRAAHRSWPG